MIASWSSQITLFRMSFLQDENIKNILLEYTWWFKLGPPHWDKLEVKGSHKEIADMYKNWKLYCSVLIVNYMESNSGKLQEHLRRSQGTRKHLRWRALQHKLTNKSSYSYIWNHGASKEKEKQLLNIAMLPQLVFSTRKSLKTSAIALVFKYQTDNLFQKIFKVV